MKNNATLPLPVRSPLFSVGSRFSGTITIAVVLASGSHATVYRLNDGLVARVYHADIRIDQELRSLLSRETEGLCRILSKGFIHGHSYDIMTHLRPYPEWSMLSDDDKKRYMLQEITAIGNLHKAGYCHLDIKPEHFMLDAAGQVRLIDFGAAKKREGADGQERLHFTPAYAAPEVKLGIYNEASDVYSWGMTIKERETYRQNTSQKRNRCDWARIVRETTHPDRRMRWTIPMLTEYLQTGHIEGCAVTVHGNGIRIFGDCDKILCTRAAQELVEMVRYAEAGVAAAQLRRLHHRSIDEGTYARAALEAIATVPKDRTRNNLTNITAANLRAVLGTEVATQLPVNVTLPNAASPGEVFGKNAIYIIGAESFREWKAHQAEIARLRRERNMKVLKTCLITGGVLAIAPFILSIAAIVLVFGIIIAICR